MTASIRENMPSRSRITDLMIFRNKAWQHLIFWLVALMILFSIFKSSGSFEKIDVIYTIIFLVPIACMVYLNLYMAIPRFLRKEKYLSYIFILMFLMGGGASFLYFLFDRWIDIFLPGYYFISYYSLPVLMLYMGSFLMLTTLLKLSRSWFMLLRVERLTSTHQLQALQSQINPHFLLNSLQTIYALSLEKSERSPEVILQLSEILKYTLYETGQPNVDLEQEIGTIKSYVDMYRHRVDPDQTEITMRISGDPAYLLIAPMLLIPFIENSFKHGLTGVVERSFVDIQLDIAGNKLHLDITNSREKNKSLELDQAKGIGIENTRQRLDLLYPDQHKLDIEILDDTFRVKLSIELNT